MSRARAAAARSATVTPGRKGKYLEYKLRAHALKLFLELPLRDLLRSLSRVLLRAYRRERGGVLLLCLRGHVGTCGT
jgi:hypothetical protein